MVNITWDGGPVYKCETSFLDPYVLMLVLTEKITLTSKWVLRMNACAFAYEQLRMLEVYGGCTINIQELLVPEEVYYGLKRLLDVRLRGGAISTPSEDRPPVGYVKSPHPFPTESRTVKEARKQILLDGKGGDKSTSLGPLARRMEQRFHREKSPSSMKATKGRGSTETRTSTEKSNRTVSVAESDTRQKRRKIDLGPAAVPFRKKATELQSTVSPQMTPVRNDRFEKEETVSRCPGVLGRVHGLHGRIVYLEDCIP
eukprot:GHVT01008782.1.p1 GENE.GHVT01008782.1~~GHVT01008782.1.p1  ORF type:complete len:293 (+),score=-7.41 GHVT01008782.1:110-880(+)